MTIFMRPCLPVFNMEDAGIMKPDLFLGSYRQLIIGRLEQGAKFMYLIDIHGKVPLVQANQPLLMLAQITQIKRRGPQTQ